MNFTITEINGYHNKIVVKGEDIYPGDILNDKDELAFRRVQIRETIMSHLQKEKLLFDKGIKVLSLFFIDEVKKYRDYDETGEQILGEYAKIFEEEYKDAIKNLPDLFREDYNQYLIDANPNFKKKEFQELWDKISFKTIYEVQFDTQKLIQDSKGRIDVDLHISERTYEVRTGELKDGTKEQMQDGALIIESERQNLKLKTDVYTNATYDIVGEIEAQTNLTRRSILEILKAISPQKFYLVRKNPEEFIAKCSKLINEVKASLIINNIVYHKTEERHDAKTVFTNDKSALRNADLLKKHIYDFLTTDSTIEADFAKALENSVEVVVYAKLPKSFYISTPIANFSPDWAIVFDKDKVRHIYFVAETKGSDSEMDLRAIEKLKIHCATEHFKTISGGEVKFSKISSYDKLLEIVQVNN